MCVGGKFKSALYGGAIAAVAVFFAAEPATAGMGDVNPFAGYSAVADSRLAELRGGMALPGGGFVDIMAEVVVTDLNGSTILNQSFDMSDLRNGAALVSLTDLGSNNLAEIPTSARGVFAVVQSTMSNVNIVEDLSVDLSRSLMPSVQASTMTRMQNAMMGTVSLTLR
jgi:hypothetical protein